MNDRSADAVVVEACERKRITATVASDIDILDELLHADMRFGHTNGHADDKATYLNKFRTGAVRYVDADHRIDSVRVFGDAALVTFHLTMRAELATGSRQLNVDGLTVWTSTAGTWKLVAHHPTVIGA